MRRRCFPMEPQCTGFLAAVLLVALPSAARGAVMDFTPARPLAPEALRDGRLVQRQPAAAMGAGVYLVAWCDGSRQADRPTADIYCARIDARSGEVLDPQGIRVCEATDLQERPAVAFDGANFLVVWQDFRSGRHYDVYAARVTPAGKVLDRDGFPVAAAATNQCRPAVAFAGGHYVVAWMDARQYPVYGIYAARIGPEGKVLDREALPLDVEDEAAVAAARPPGDRWMGDRDYWWQRLSSRYLPVIASDGRQCLVAYLREYPFAENPRPQPTAVLFDAAAARVEAGPVRLPGGAYSTLAVCRASDRWVVLLSDHASGWGLAPRLAAIRLSDQLETTDAFAPPHTQEPDRLPLESLEKTLLPEDGAALNPGKGALCFWRPAAAWDGRQVVAAHDFGWRSRRDANAISYVIAVNRLIPAADSFAEPASRVAAATHTADQAVAHPALVAGPNGDVLLLYERDETVDRHVIEYSLLRGR